MRPLKLTMRAFGPYAGEVTIDFEKLDGRHLFLICGPTGRARPRFSMPCAMRSMGRRQAIGAARVCEATMQGRIRRRKSFLTS